jgi:hypothetical protein
VAVVGLQVVKYGSPVLSQEKRNPDGASKFNCTMVAPVKLIKSKLTNPATASAWLTVKLNVSDVSGVEAPPPPSLNTGSTPSARATEQEIPRKATMTNKRVIFTTYPRSNLREHNNQERKCNFITT